MAERGGDGGGAADRAVRVLVVEDDPIGQRVAVRLLGRLGCAADVVADGAAAIAAALSGAYALVLMDGQLPGLDGYAATTAIRQHEAVAGRTGDDGRRPPIVLLTSSARPEDHARARAVGMDDVLVRPFGEEELAALLGRWLPGAGDAGRRLEPAPAPPTPELGAGSESASESEWGTAPGMALDLRPDANLPVLDPAGLPGPGVVSDAERREIVRLFLAQTEQRVAALGDALARGQHAEATRLAHTLAGSSNSLGAVRLAAACARVEALARRGEAAPSAALAEVEAELTRVRQALGELAGEATDAPPA